MIYVEIDKTQQNRKCRLCGDRDETINRTISKCSKLISSKEYKTRHDWVGKVIHRKLCKKLKFDHTIKWYMYNPESILKNERGCPRGVMVKAMDCGIVVREFVLHSRYYVLTGKYSWERHEPPLSSQLWVK